MEHKLYEPEGKEGIYICSVCRGAEASLPTECPGRRMTEKEQDKVQAMLIDYVHGKWISI